MSQYFWSQSLELLLVDRQELNDLTKSTGIYIARTVTYTGRSHLSQFFWEHEHLSSLLVLIYIKL